jgi:hypothetical protein
MPIEDDIKKEIAKLAHEGKYDDLSKYVRKKLEEKAIVPQDILAYAKDYKWTSKPEKPYVINAATINKIGVAVLELKLEENVSATEFYKLASERGSSWGSRNCAQHLLGQALAKDETDEAKKQANEKKEQALAYAKKAVEQAEDEKIDPRRHKGVLCKALRKNSRYVEANGALVEYLELVLSWNDSDAKTKEIKIILLLFAEIIQEFQAEFADEATEARLSDAHCTAYLEELDPLLTDSPQLQKCKEYKAIQYEAYYFKGKCHEKLGQYAEAMSAYCTVTDEKHPLYGKAVDGRRRVLQQQLNRDFPDAKQAVQPAAATTKSPLHPTATTNVPPHPVDKSDDKSAAKEVHDKGDKHDKEEKKATKHKEEKRKKEKRVDALQLPGGTLLPVQFNEAWKRESSWFHTVDSGAIKEEFEKRSEQFKKLVSAKRAQIDAIEVELELVEEMPRDTPATVATKEKLETSKQALQLELQKLNDLKKEYEKKRKTHSGDHRQAHRRHMAETNFFDPRRSKKAAEICALTTKVINHRYNHDDSKLDPVKLDGKSARVVISSERAFQETEIALRTKKRKAPITPLSIPIKRRKPWESQSGYSSGTTNYGPPEHYQVGETMMTSEHQVEPQCQRLGNSYVSKAPTYNSINYFFSKLTEKDAEKEKQLAKFMIGFGLNHQPVSLTEVQAMDAKADQDTVDQFNRVCFLVMEKEQGQWHSATDERYQLGMSVGQARCLIMLEAGFLRLNEVFVNGALFGIYSQNGIVNNPQQVADACKHVDTLYLAYLSRKQENAREHIDFLKRQIDPKNCLMAVLTRQQAFEDLKYVYGGKDDDVNNDGYDTELDMPTPSPAPRIRFIQR